MNESTRREFLQVACTVAAASVLLPAARASAQIPGTPPLPVPQALPAGPGAPYSGYQSEIYIAGMGVGDVPIFTTNLTALGDVAERRLSPSARRHLLTWAGGTAAERANARALDAWRIVPRMFVDRADRDLTTTVLGVEMAAPIILGPVGNQKLLHPDGEASSARAATELGLTFVHPPQASTPVEGVAAAAPLGSRWLGLDWPSGGTPDTALLRRARSAGYTHLVLSPPQPGGSWAALAATRRAWDGPVILGGIQSVTDAREAVRRGVDGLVVSNERGRRGERVGGTIDMLPRVVDAVGDRVPVLFGSGVRTGTDVFRALALGARAVLLGRPYVHGLALAGQEGVRHMLRTLLAELDITIGVAAAGPIARELGRDALVRA